MARREDYLRVCNDRNVRVDDFTAQFCARCHQAECERSLHGQRLFDQRAVHWERKLFLEVPRMPEADPRFSQLRAKHFLEIPVGRIPEIHSAGWHDPRDLEPSPEPRRLPVLARPRSETVLDAEVEPEAPLMLSEPEALELVREPVAAPQALNTTRRQGQMLGGRAAPSQAPAAPVKDPWAGPATTGPAGVTVVQPGQRIKLSGV